MGYGSFKWWVQHLEEYNQYNVRNILRNIFQPFWKQDSCPNGLFIQLETLNFGVLMESKKIKRWTNIKFVQISSNFVQFRKIKKVTTSQKLKSLTQKTKNRGNYQVSRTFGKYSFYVLLTYTACSWKVLLKNMPTSFLHTNKSISFHKIIFCIFKKQLINAQKMQVHLKNYSNIFFWPANKSSPL